MTAEDRQAWGEKMKALRFARKNSANFASNQPTLPNPPENILDAKQEDDCRAGDDDEKIPGGQPQNPSRAIRKFCVECVGSVHEVRTCCAYSCPLWDHRFGVRPSSAMRRNSDLMSREKVRELNAKRGRSK